MKTLKLRSMSWLMVVAMMFGVVFASCSDENEPNGDNNDSNFPELVEKTCNVDETIELTFTANGEWKLSSNAAWCKLVSGSFAETSIQGTAGEQTITVQISGDSQNYENDDVAEITLSMGGKEQVICKITRPKKVFSGLTVKDDAGNVFDSENPIVIKGSGLSDADIEYTSVIAEAEFKVGVTEYPTWLSVTSTEDGTFSFTFKNDNEDGRDPKYSFGADAGYVITFGVETNEGRANVSIPVIYEGLKADVLSINPAYNQLKVSKNGKKIVQEDLNSGTRTVYENEITSTITARDDNYEVVKVNQIGEYMSYPGMDPVFYPSGFDFEEVNTAWVQTSQDKENLSVSFVEFPEDSENEYRSVVIMAFPKALYDELKNGEGGLNSIIDNEMVDIASAYQRYIVATVMQTEDELADPEIGFAAYIDMDGEWMDMSMISGESPVFKQGENLWAVSFEKAIFSMGTIYLEVQNYSDNMTISVSENSLGVTIEPNVVKDGKHYITLSGTPSDSGAQAVIKVQNGDEEVTCTIQPY